jgi:AcrR family transcriptional regulator
MRDYDGKTAVERAAERRARLIDAGLQLFGERGYAGTSIRAILRQSGLRDRYWSESFSDLDSLLAAAYQQLIDKEVAACRAAIEAAPGPSEGARAMIETLTRIYMGNPGDARVKLREILSGGPVSSNQRQSALYELAQLVADLLPATTATNENQRLSLGRGVVAAAEEFLRAWIDGEGNMARKDVVDLTMLLFDSLAARLVHGSDS